MMSLVGQRMDRQLHVVGMERMAGHLGQIGGEIGSTPIKSVLLSVREKLLSSSLPLLNQLKYSIFLFYSEKPANVRDP